MMAGFGRQLGLFTAGTYSRSKTFKTKRGAMNWLLKSVSTSTKCKIVK